jgi:hypothetical protein
MVGATSWADADPHYAIAHESSKGDFALALAIGMACAELRNLRIARGHLAGVRAVAQSENVVVLGDTVRTGAELQRLSQADAKLRSRCPSTGHVFLEHL